MIKKYQNDFCLNFKQCLNELYAFTNIESVKKLIDIYDKLDMSKVMNKYLELADKYDRELKSKNDIMFENPITLFPGIDMSVIWKLLNDEQKNIIWSYLQLLYTSGQVILQSIPLYGFENDALENLSSECAFNFNEPNLCNEHENVKKCDKKPHTLKACNNTESNEKHNKINDVTTIIDKINKLENLDLGKKKKKMDFDPYVGVGNVSGKFDINDMIENIKCKEESDNGLFDIVTNMMNNNGGCENNEVIFEKVAKMLNIDDVVKQIESISTNEIDDTSDKIKDVVKTKFGNESDAGNLINDIIGNITDEFKKGFGNKKMNSMEKIKNITTGIAEKILPKIESSNIQLDEILKSALELHNNCNTTLANKHKQKRKYK